ncbi:hypothetical protein AURDEDRAFT_117340 [Auricularia subglabra TFB-10046 SS5]|nr:hypothetical protein AURDEDRAFT_117340 [Auricularia subglabra TFB-10046 SS5]
MFENIVLVVLTWFLLVGHSLAQPEFVMNCTKWPDICDNTCNALYCHNITDLLRYDPNSTTDMPNLPFRRTSADYRRENVGCGANNYCPGTMDCDEFPYASTFDGGVGCISGGFNVSQSGTTRCANRSQNRSHGATLAQFFRNMNLTRGAMFRVVVRNDAALESSTSAVCKSVHPGRNGTRMCPTDRAVYRFRDTPAASFCPSRP